MIKKAVLGLILVFVTSLSIFTVQAQDAITAGEPVKGEITDDDYAIQYTYEGKEDEVIVIELKPQEIFELSTPSIIVRNENGSDLLRADGITDTTLVTILPRDGTYTIIATRMEDANGTGEGEYTLLLTTPQDLIQGDTIEAEIDSDSAHYYVYRGDEDFSFTYTRDGEFSPEVSVNTIGAEFSVFSTITPVLAVSGKEAKNFTMNDIEGDEVYVIRIGKGLLDFVFTPVDAEYTLTIGESE